MPTSCIDFFILRERKIGMEGGGREGGREGGRHESIFPPIHAFTG